ncbi:MAG TPA: hypothetical protein VNK95_01805, partial [Caldilineaceae bacterium]|nr:hypothetical protein [Caldilineaceae bacterium]
MLEQCPTLADCEKALARAVQDVVLLGDLPLTDDDLERLTRLIRVYKQPFQLLRNAPTCLVCLLVFVGRTSYEEGAYWHGVEAHLGPLDGNRQRQLGRFFRRYVRMRGLLLPQVEGGYAYVTPILVHAGIPQHCLPEFFSKVVAPLVTRAGVIAPSEVAVQLNVWRSQAEERARLQQRLDEQIEPQSLLDVEKPIVRYLIYGGSSAERLLTKAVGLFGRCLESGAIDEQLLADLPPYVGRAFRQWWQTPATRTSLHEDSPRDRFRTPAIQLDATAQRVELLLPSQAYTVQEGLPSLLVMDAATARTLVQLPLRSRRRGAQVETEPLTLELETPAEEYQIRLQVDDQTLRQWTLPTRAGALPCRLFAGPRRQLLRDPPPPEP